MNFAGYEPVDLINGEGVRCSLWVSGCSHGCRGCFNQKTWSYSYGKPFTDENVEQVLKDLSRPFVKGLTILGGEPLDPQNIHNVKSLIEKVRDVYGSSKDIMVYTGYTFEEVPLYIKNLIDIIVDGKYEINNPTTKPFRGSDNQRLWTKTASGWQSD